MTLEVTQGGRTVGLRVPDDPTATVTVLAALAISAEVWVDAPCGGRGRCGRCIVRIPVFSSATAPPSAPADTRFLSRSDLEQGYRLACVTPASAVKQVILPDRDDRARVKDTVPLFDTTPIVWDTARLEGPTAVAIDLGTTTVAAYLLDTRSAAVTSVTSEINRQAVFGADVISRISYAEESPEHLKRLVEAIRNQLRGMLSTISPPVGTVVVTGNTTMLHLLAEISPAGIGRAPFTPEFIDLRRLTGPEIGLGNSGSVFLLPSVAAYVGADIICAAVAADMDRDPATTLLVDIGTNGEVALSHGGRILTCATAAGPAFEGVTIGCGVGGVAGAIASFHRDGPNLTWTTIADAPPAGLCGAGLLDLVALLLADRVIDETGRITFEMTDKEARSAWSERLVHQEGQPAITVTGPYLLTQKDVREVQLAKAAIAAGIDVLCRDAGITTDEIQRVVLTGGFGNHLSVESAITVGLVPALPLQRYRSVDNAAGRGAVLVLRNSDTLERMQALARSAHYVELSTHPLFQERFVEQMLFTRHEEQNEREVTP